MAGGGIGAIGPIMSLAGGAGGGKGGGGSGLSGQQIALSEYEKNQQQLAGRTQYAGAGMGTSTNAALAMAGPEAGAVASMIGQQEQNQQLSMAEAQNLGNQLDQAGQAGGLASAAGSSLLG